MSSVFMNCWFFYIDLILRVPFIYFIVNINYFLKKM